MLGYPEIRVLILVGALRQTAFVLCVQMTSRELIGTGYYTEEDIKYFSRMLYAGVGVGCLTSTICF